jgi:hypothetical protein
MSILHAVSFDNEIEERKDKLDTCFSFSQRESNALRLSLVRDNSPSPQRMKNVSNFNQLEEHFERSLALMLHGFVATKFHYSRQSNEKCTVRISEDLKFLTWTYYHKSLFTPKDKDRIGKCKNIQQLSNFIGAFSTVKGLLYGAQTSTFLKYKK